MDVASGELVHDLKTERTRQTQLEGALHLLY